MCLWFHKYSTKRLGNFYTKGKSDGQQKSNNSVFIYVKNIIGLKLFYYQ